MTSFLVLNAYLELVYFDFHLARGNFLALHDRVRSHPLGTKAQPRRMLSHGSAQP